MIDETEKHEDFVFLEIKRHSKTKDVVPILNRYPIINMRVWIGKSPIHGIGLFSMKTIKRGEFITFYPCDMVSINTRRIYSHSMAMLKSIDWTEETFPDHTLHIGDVSITAHPGLRSDPSYMGHFINDAAVCKEDTSESRAAYALIGLGAWNCEFRMLDLGVAAFATRDISYGEEILRSYGDDWWIKKNNS